MFLALREIRRAKARFGLLMAAVALLMFLILTQQALQSGLITAFVGAIERQSAPVLVYAVDGQRTLQGSVITPPLEKAIAGVPGVAETGRIGQGTFTVSMNGGDQSDAALIGYEKPQLGGPDRLSAGRMPRAAGEAVGSAADFSLGDRVAVVGRRRRSAPARRGPGRGRPDPGDPDALRLLVRLRGRQAGGQPGRRDRPAERHRGATGSRRQRRGARVPDQRRLPQADALTREQAAAETPGVADVQRSFDVIFLLFALVVPLVTGLFFLIITLQKARALTLLRAIGAPAGVLVRSLLVQVLIIIGGGIVIGTLLYAPLSQATVGSLSLRFDTASRGPVGGAAPRPRAGERGRGGPARAGHRPRRGHDRGRCAVKLALRELRRRPGRFVVATAILTLIALLLMFLGGLLDGLDGREHRRAARPAGRAHRVLGRLPGLAGAQPHHPGGARAGGGGRRSRAGGGPRQRPARRARRGARSRAISCPSCSSATSARRAGCPTPCPAPGQVYADSSLRSEGVTKGSRHPPRSRPVRRSR